MGLYDLMATDIGRMIARDGVSVSYTPYGGTKATIKILYSIRQEFGDIEGGFLGSALEAVVDIADVASPQPNDTITLAGVVWTVRDPITEGIACHVLTCTRDERKEYK